MRVLIVEDKADLASMLRADLEGAGHTVDTAYDGLEGEEKARGARYDLMVVDWSLPKQDSRTLVQHLHEMQKDAHVLLLTAVADHDTIGGMDCCADDYLMKPFLSEELLEHVQRFGNGSHVN